MVYIVGLYFTIQQKGNHMNTNDTTNDTAITTLDAVKAAYCIGIGFHNESKVMSKVQKVGAISGQVGTTSAAIIGVHAITGTPMAVGTFKVLKAAALVGITTGAACGLASLGYVITKAVQHWANGNARLVAKASAEEAAKAAAEAEAEVEE